jgi:phosphoadenosine phosphosulfate reductase
MLVTDGLFEKIDKVKTALERIKTFEPHAQAIDSRGYYVCISGGKDSSVIQELCIMAGVKCEFVHNHTSVDHPETVYFVRREKERIEKMGYIFRIEIPRYPDGRQITMWNGIVKKGLPTRLRRWCCEKLKESGGMGRYCITGVRWAESLARKGRGIHEEQGKTRSAGIILNNDNDMKRRLSEICIPKRKYILNPIVDWSNDDVWEFIRLYNLPINPLYSQGYLRVGCIGCPLSANGRKELEKFPKYKQAYYRAAQRRIDYRKEKGLSNKWLYNDVDHYFSWWISGGKVDDGDPLFDDMGDEEL